MSDDNDKFVDDFVAAVDALVRRQAPIESGLLAWSSTNGRAGLTIRTALHVTTVPLSIGACGRLKEFLDEHVAWTAVHTEGPTSEMVEDQPPMRVDGPRMHPEYDDRTPVTEQTRREFLLFFFHVASRDGHPLLSPEYVEEKIDLVHSAKEVWRLEQMLSPARIREWREWLETKKRVS